MGGAIGALLTVVLVVLAAVFGVYLLIKLFGVLIKVFAHVFRFIGAEFSDAFRLIGAVLLTVLLVPMVIGNIVIGRWSAASHFGTAIKAELATAGGSIYRLVLGNPARLFMLTGVTEGLEQRLPAVVAAAPTRDVPRNPKTTGKFEGYNIVGSLAGGGSGGKLYVAEPDDVKRAVFERSGQSDVDKVVIKTFSLGDGSSLPQIVRESRALDSAKKLGLVLEHELTDARFFYVMRYVPGKSLSLTTQDMHASSGGEGLDDKRLNQAVGLVEDLLETLGVYHAGGLWHKDVKPDNIIVSDNRAHLVDLGLVTPLRSAMTLTTHGTEYFRDPELVRMALKGVKVHQVDGGKFDVFAAGAVLYSVIENSFPAHGGLSHVRKRCPEALRWVIRRSMAEYDQRYETCGDMLMDLRAIRGAEDPFAMKPIDLPSMKVGGDLPELEEAPEIPNFGDRAPAPGVVQAAAYKAAHDKPGFTPRPEQPRHKPEDRPAARAARRRSRAPQLQVSNWWTGKYAPSGPARAAEARRGSPAPDATPRPARRQAPMPEPRPRPEPRPLTPVDQRAPAQDQLRNARERAAARREAAQERIRARRGKRGAPAPSNVNAGVGAAMMSFLGAAVIAAGLVLYKSMDEEPAPKVTANVLEATINGQDVEVSLDGGTKGVMLGIADAFREAYAEAREAPMDHVERALSPRGTVLLVNGLSAPVQMSKTHELAAMRGSLAAEGWPIDEHEESTAELRYAMGEDPLDSAGSFARINEWLETSERFDAVLWIETAGIAEEGKPAPMRAGVFTGGSSRVMTFSGEAALAAVSETTATFLNKAFDEDEL